MTGKSAVLRSERGSGDSRHLEASLTPEGDLVIEGQDLGDTVEKYYGFREYEWIWTIRAGDIPILLKALGVASDVLSALNQRFNGNNAADLKALLDSHEIPHEVWSRMAIN